MSTQKITTFILLALIAVTAVIGAVLYPSLPDQIASHWNTAGEANGWSSKFWGVFLFPLLMAGLFALYFIIPRIDPLKANIESFRKYYDKFWVLMFAFFAYIFGLSMWWNLGYEFNFTAAMVPAMAVMLYSLGVITERTKRNWFVGIRTPWTLSSDVVWDKTHKLGGKLFKIAAAISLVGLVFRDGKMIFATLVIPLMVVVLVTVLYSYLEFRKQPKGGA
jgi:uncharacterized membrane protein